MGNREIVYKVINEIEASNKEVENLARERIDSLAKPLGSLGKL